MQVQYKNYVIYKIDVFWYVNGFSIQFHTKEDAIKYVDNLIKQ